MKTFVVKIPKGTWNKKGAAEKSNYNFIIIIALGMAVFDQKRILPFSADSLFDQI
jgi:hypothetical protein